MTIYENVIGCKWARQILFLIADGTTRPSAITRTVKGLTPKVQTDCLKKLTRFGFLERQDFDEAPPRVEYQLTSAGKRLIKILEAVVALERDLNVDYQS